MAHQAHAIPWNTLSSNFKYTILPHINTQSAEIYPLDKPSQGNDLEYFCTTFAKQIQAFAISERGKYPPASLFSARANTWTVSNMSPDLDVITEHDEHLATTETNIGKRAQRSPKPETRKVFSDSFKAKYSVSYSPGWNTYMDAAQNIAAWLPQQPDLDSWPYDQNSGLEIVKLLIMEAAAASYPIKERDEKGPARQSTMENLLLLANHKILPERLKIWRSCHGGFNNYGINTVAENALIMYIILNLLFAMRDSGSDVCSLATTSQPEKVSSSPRFNDAEKKAKYMKTTVWPRAVAFAISDDHYHSEVLMHRPYLYPQWDLNKEVNDGMLERNVMAEERVGELREYLKGLWRVLVVYEVLWSEMGVEIDWREQVAKTLKFLFRRLKDEWDGVLRKTTFV